MYVETHFLLTLHKHGFSNEMIPPWAAPKGSIIPPTLDNSKSCRFTSIVVTHCMVMAHLCSSTNATLLMQHPHYTMQHPCASLCRAHALSCVCSTPQPGNKSQAIFWELWQINWAANKCLHACYAPNANEVLNFWRPVDICRKERVHHLK